jgi:hypothetical protein
MRNVGDAVTTNDLLNYGMRTVFLSLAAAIIVLVGMFVDDPSLVKSRVRTTSPVFENQKLQAISQLILDRS